MKACNQLCPWNTIYGCHKPENEPCILSNMPCESFEQKPMTNAQRIRSMTDDELAEFIATTFENGKISVFAIYPELRKNHCGLDWLRQPYEED